MGERKTRREFDRSDEENAERKMKIKIKMKVEMTINMTISTGAFQRIEESLNSNQYCNIGALNSRRIFSANINSFPQILVLVTCEGDYGEIWGHVFLKDEKWVTILVGSDGNFKGSSDDEIIKDYTRNIKKRAGWQTLNAVKDCDYMGYSTTFEEAIERLTYFIGKVNPDCYTFDCGIDETNPWLAYDIYGSGPLYRSAY